MPRCTQRNEDPALPTRRRHDLDDPQRLFVRPVSVVDAQQHRRRVGAGEQRLGDAMDRREPSLGQRDRRLVLRRRLDA
jgi:hypothetical protein